MTELLITDQPLDRDDLEILEAVAARAEGYDVINTGGNVYALTTSRGSLARDGLYAMATLDYGGDDTGRQWLIGLYDADSDDHVTYLPFEVKGTADVVAALVDAAVATAELARAGFGAPFCANCCLVVTDPDGSCWCGEVKRGDAPRTRTFLVHLNVETIDERVTADMLTSWMNARLAELASPTMNLAIADVDEIT